MRRPSCVILIALAAIAAGCSQSGSGQPGGPGGQGGGGGRGRGRGGPGAVVSVQTTALRRISLARRVDLAGTLLSPDQAKVSSEVAGIVRAVLVELGTEVRPGDVLARVEPREIELALERAESALRQVEAQLGIDRSRDKQPPPDELIASVRQAAANRDDARAGFVRAEQLTLQGLLSKVDHDTAETRLKVAEANYQAALDTAHSLKAALQDRRAAFELARKKLADTAIKAPVAGSISERFVQPGEFIRENTPVVTIVQMNPLKLKTSVQERHAAVIKPDQPVDFAVEAFPGKTFSGKIAYVSPAVDQTTRTFVVEAMVDNAARLLKPGFFAKGAVQTRIDDDVLAVPEEAISTLAGVSTVYVLDGGKARQQQVTLGERQGDVVEVIAGLKGDETLASTNLSQLATGTSVRTGRGADAPAGGRRGGGRGRGSGNDKGRGNLEGRGDGEGRANGEGGRQ